jgi:hypothetical protein
MISSLRSRLGRKAYGIAALTALVVAALGATAPGASASTAPHSGRLPAISGHVSASLTAPSTIRSRHDAPQTATSCTVTPSAPFEYYGGPYGGGEDGVAEATCTGGTVYALEVIVALFLNGTEVSYNTNTDYVAVTASANTDYPLSAGDYTTEAQVCVTWTLGGSTTCSGIAASSTVYLP